MSMIRYEATGDMREAAAAMRGTFNALIEVGFTSEQAMSLMLASLSSGAS